MVQREFHCADKPAASVPSGAARLRRALNIKAFKRSCRTFGRESLRDYDRLWRLQNLKRVGEKQQLDFTAPGYFLRKSIRHAKELLAKLNDNDDRALLAAGNATLSQGR